MERLENVQNITDQHLFRIMVWYVNLGKRHIVIFNSQHKSCSAHRSPSHSFSSSVHYKQFTLPSKSTISNFTTNYTLSITIISNATKIHFRVGLYISKLFAGSLEFMSEIFKNKCHNVDFNN